MQRSKTIKLSTKHMAHNQRPSRLTSLLDDALSDMQIWWLNARQHPELLTLGAVGIVLLIAVATRVITDARPAAALPTPVPVAPLQVTRLEPTADPRPRLSQAVVVYDAPGGSVIGPVEHGRVYTVTATSGTDWTQIDVAGSGVVWVRSCDIAPCVPDLATPLPTVVPTSVPTAAPVVEVSAPAVVVQAEPTTTAQPSAQPTDWQAYRDEIERKRAAGELDYLQTPNAVNCGDGWRDLAPGEQPTCP